MMKHFVLHVWAILMKRYQLLFMPKKLNVHLSQRHVHNTQILTFSTLDLNETIYYLVMGLDWKKIFNNCYGTLVIVNQYGCDSNISYITLAVHLKC